MTTDDPSHLPKPARRSIAAPDDVEDWLLLADARTGELPYGTPPRMLLAGMEGGLLEIS
jgi:hypothetical protein